jgi:hypothetical protein
MLDRLVHIAWWASLGITVVVMLVNAFYMVVSPKAWFRLHDVVGPPGRADAGTLQFQLGRSTSSDTGHDNHWDGRLDYIRAAGFPCR